MNIKIELLSNPKTDKELLDREKKFGGFYKFKLISPRGKIVSLEQIKKLTKSGKEVIIGDINNSKYINCGLNKNDPWDGIIPVVRFSNHPRFSPGTRFDYGFMCVAIEERYSISYNFERKIICK